nr:GNAT family N-acetyltransferase [Deinobacterium chartae]
MATPQYFEILGTHVPSQQEVESEVALAQLDPRRHLELLLDGELPIGCIDYKTDYPHAGDVTLNLLLISAPFQNRGYGKRAVALLEERLSGAASRLLASVLGENARAVHFWESQGYRFAVDAKPVMSWYAKPLAQRAPLASDSKQLAIL